MVDVKARMLWIAVAVVALAGCGDGEGGWVGQTAANDSSEPVIDQQPQDCSVYAGDAAAFTIEAHADGTIAYQWQRSEDAGTSWTDLLTLGATTDTFTTSATTLADSGAQFRCVLCCDTTVYSDAATLTVDATEPEVDTQPTDQTVTEGETATFSVVASGREPLSYQWQRSDDAGASWANLLVSGATSDSCTTASTVLADDGAQLRCLVSNLDGSTMSDAATLTVNMAPPTIDSHPDNAAVVEGETAGFSVTASSSGAMSYQWQRSDDAGASWNDLLTNDATTEQYTTQATLLDDDGARFRCQVANLGGTAVSLAASLSVVAGPPTIDVQPEDQSVEEGQSATFEVTASGAGTLTYQWRRSNDAGASWLDVAGATSASYTTTAASLADDGAQFLCVVSNGGTTESDAATLTVTAAPPSVVSDPADQTVTEGETATFSLIATGSDPLSYQWQRSDDAGATWSDLLTLSATTDIYTTPATVLADDDAQFQCIVMNSVGTTACSPALLTVVMAPPTITAQPSDQTVTEGDTATFTVAADSSGPLSYQWQRSDDSGASWTDLLTLGATSDSYTTPVTTLTDDGAQFRCEVTNDGGSVESDAASLTVDMAPPVITAHPEDETVIAGASAAFAVAASGSGTLTYQWRRSDDGGATWDPIAGADAINYSLGSTELADDGAKFCCLVANMGGTALSNPALLTVTTPVYVKASNTDAGDGFGVDIALDGDTMIVGAFLEDCGATGINGVQVNNSAQDAGAVYAYVRNGSTWDQQAYIKASNTGAGDRFGWSVALDGDTLVVGAPNEDSAATGVNGNGSDNSASDAGAVYVFVRSGSAWEEQAYLKASDAGADDGFGCALALEGDTLAVGARSRDGGGGVYVFTRSGTTWTQQTFLKGANTEDLDYFGSSIAIKGDKIAVGAPNEDGSSPGVNGSDNNLTSAAGAVYIFVRSGSAWSQEAYVKASSPGSNDRFGGKVSLTNDTLAVGAFIEDGSAIGINGTHDDWAFDAGAAYVFVHDGTTWAQQAYIKASNTDAYDYFGWRLALVEDVLVIGSVYECSGDTNLNGDQTSDAADDAGAAYIFVRDGTSWNQAAYVKASNTEAGDHFTWGVAFDGATLAIGATGEDSSAIGVGGDEADNAAADAGAVFVYDWAEEF